MRFLNLKTLLTLLMTTGAIAVDVLDRSWRGKERPSRYLIS
jgi:hypothetical protein